jgi:hypothetical protein
MAMIALKPKYAKRAADAFLKAQKKKVHGFSTVPIDRINEVKRVLRMAELAEDHKSLMYVTFEDLVVLGLEDEFILGEDYSKPVP